MTHGVVVLQPSDDERMIGPWRLERRIARPAMTMRVPFGATTPAGRRPRRRGPRRAAARHRAGGRAPLQPQAEAVARHGRDRRIVGREDCIEPEPERVDEVGQSAAKSADGRHTWLVSLPPFHFSRFTSHFGHHKGVRKMFEG